ncbi:hypothetical protein SERLA73DRAFT_175561 [Serpula lacrymans var. lacrymans S7.3]|uniref:Malate dehydrogenase n=2 Tax=Serpula lacrymans var. lacrymans TaxID=341189 RepID=F8PKF7_SERL3|nr:uncharacterized protein SERLADRAFT_458078 [Serpula lacrymans var. lacrymans S7.9]EGO03871.1 hypothetical protein SERLA73DRAFT_175561 [Serpula lacrymans var. lacrymans S7.3]EGO29798.1 hypothetical protein SERLADRAFT_458078 [Serpula lacrymans var. lacrymans S7.9]
MIFALPLLFGFGVSSTSGFSLLSNLSILSSCNLSHAVLQVPANQTQLVAPTFAPNFIGMGVGVQNYSCNATSSTYELVGAVAELFDVSCLYGTPAFESTPAQTYTAWNASSAITSQEIIGTLSLLEAPVVLGQHYYVANPVGSGLSPKWDFTSSGYTTGNSNAYMIGVKKGDIPSPDTEVNIDSLEVANVKGGLATTVFRVNNNGGQPPATCTPGTAPIAVKYVSQYWFFGGSVTPESLPI